MKLNIPDNPTRITINFQTPATDGEVSGILEFIEPTSIQNIIEDGVHQVLLETREGQPLSDEAKECLQKIADRDNLVSFNDE